MMLFDGLLFEEHQEHQGLQDHHGRKLMLFELRLLDRRPQVGRHLDNDGHCSARLTAGFDQEPDPH